MKRRTGVGIGGVVAVLTAGVLAASSGCTQPISVPGTVMGTFAFTAELPLRPDGGLDTDCPFSELPTSSFDFVGTFSWEPDTPQVWFTLGNVVRGATFDGQIADSTLETERQFEECAGGVVMRERLRVALISKSQFAAGVPCSSAALEPGALPYAPPEITRPGSTGSGFDAVQACGTMEDVVFPIESCETFPPDAGLTCVMTFSVHGVRK